MPRHNSPLRYPGGKAFFSKFLAHVIETNELQDGVYVEPFAGGAGAAIELLLAGYVSELKLNDANHGVYSFWMAATRHADDLCRLIYNDSSKFRYQRKATPSFTKFGTLLAH